MHRRYMDNKLLHAAELLLLEAANGASGKSKEDLVRVAVKLQGMRSETPLSEDDRANLTEFVSQLDR